jgi:hypothetical protein
MRTTSRWKHSAHLTTPQAIMQWAVGARPETRDVAFETPPAYSTGRMMTFKSDIEKVAGRGGAQA